MTGMYGRLATPGQQGKRCDIYKLNLTGDGDGERMLWTWWRGSLGPPLWGTCYEPALRVLAMQIVVVCRRT